MEMKVLLVDSDRQLCAELVVMLHMFQCFRVVENVQTAEEAIAYVQFNAVDVSLPTTSPPTPALPAAGSIWPPSWGRAAPIFRW